MQAHKQLDKNRKKQADEDRRQTDSEMKGGRWTDRKAGRHNTQTHRKERQTGWQKINRLEPREQSNRRNGEGSNMRNVNIEKHEGRG